MVPSTGVEVKIIYSLITICGLLAAALLYGLRFEDLSETLLIQYAYIWVPITLFGLFGRMGIQRGKGGLLHGLLGAVTGTLGLFLFFEVIFPAL